MSNNEINITLASTTTGQSDSIAVDTVSTTLEDVVEWSRALLGLEGELVLFKDGKPLAPNMTPTTSLKDAGVVNGDLIAIQPQRTMVRAPPPPAAASGGGLDFSALLNSAPPPAASTSTTNARGRPLIQYYPGMALDEAMELNPHPESFCELLLKHEHLWKELNYHNPVLAQRLRGKSVPEAAALWRESLVKGSIRKAHARTMEFQKEAEMRLRLNKDAQDKQAKEYFERKSNQDVIDMQLAHVREEYPETMGRVLMLYIQAKVNHVSISTFVDSGAQHSVMSKQCADKCGISHLIDTRFEGMAVGVGTGKILGRIHICTLEVMGSYFPCSIQVMDGMGDKNMEFLLGLDMLKRHLCCIDLEQQCLKFKLSADTYLKAPFLHEKDLDQSKGGTIGFDAEQENQKVQEILQQQQQQMEEENGNDDSNMDVEEKKPSSNHS